MFGLLKILQEMLERSGDAYSSSYKFWEKAATAAPEEPISAAMSTMAEFKPAPEVVEEVVRQAPIDFSVWASWMSLLVLFLAAFGIYVYRKKTSKLFGVVSNNLLLVSVVVWFLGVAIYSLGFFSTKITGWGVMPRAIISSFKMFVAANELARVDETLRKDAIYMTAFSIIHFAAAFLTLVFVFRLIAYKLKSSIKEYSYRFSLWLQGNKHTVHLFWGINEASILLAEDIDQNDQHKDDTIILVDIDDEKENSNQKKVTLSNVINTITIKDSEMVRLDELKNVLVDHCYGGPASVDEKHNNIFGALRLKGIGSIVQRSPKVNFYFLSDNEAKNIMGALKLKGDCRLHSKDVTIYIHARRDSNNEIFDHYSQYNGLQKVKTKIIDSAYLSIETLMKPEKKALPVQVLPSESVDRSTGVVTAPFTALLVGFGQTGQEAFKFLYEFSAFVGPDHKRIPFKCYAFDENMDKLEGLMRKRMPSIGEEELTLIKAKVDSEPFWNKIAEILDELNYVVVAINNEELGLSFAVNLFKYALRERSSELPKLKIMLRSYSNGNKQRMEEVVDNLNKSVGNLNVELGVFGQESQIYLYDTIVLEEELLKAKDFHKAYKNSTLSAKDQWEKSFGNDVIAKDVAEEGISRYHAIYNINRKVYQNISNAQHCYTKMFLMGFDEESLAQKEGAERLAALCQYVQNRKQHKDEYEAAKDRDEKVDARIHLQYDCPEEVSQLLFNLARVEKERWNAAHRLLGYVKADTTDHIKKRSSCLCAWDELRGEGGELDVKTQSYDCDVVDTTLKLAYNKLMGER